MKKYVLFLFIVLLAFTASAQAYVSTGLIGIPTSPLLMPGCNSALLLAASPSLLPALIGCSSPLISVHSPSILPVMTNVCVTPVVSPFCHEGSSIQVVQIQTSTTTPSVQDMILSIINNND